MTDKEIDEMYMRRCLQLAKNGRQNAKPNPMVGAVIVCDGRIIGEGYHVRCGEGHAEVNAFASVKADDEQKLLHSTIYVSLEPCSHFGRTPPCADLIISKGVRRVVVGCIDPFAAVHGRGVNRLVHAGIKVTVGVLEKECRELNKRFISSSEKQRPYIILKWCETANGLLDDNYHPAAISTPFTKMLSHKLRAENDAILVGRITDERDHPQLNIREWYGRDPLRLILSHDTSIKQILDKLYDNKLQSLIVEGGAKTHQSFIDAGLWDEIRIETAPITFTGGTHAPQLPTNVRLIENKSYDGNRIVTYERI